jgi:hypothetical protein
MDQAKSGAADEKDGTEYLGADVGSEDAARIADSLNPDEGEDMGAGRDATGKRYMGGTGGVSSPEQSERNADHG